VSDLSALLGLIYGGCGVKWDSKPWNGPGIYEAEMPIVGEGGAGKTTLLRRLYQPDQPMPAENESTKGISIYRHTFALKNGRTFRLNVWDFGGQEIYHATHQFFLTHRSLYVLLDDTRKDDKSVQDPGFSKWLDLVEVFGGGSPVLIFQNEKSGRSKSIDIDGIKSRYTNVTEKYEGDLDKKNAADRLRDAIEYYAANLSHIGEELPCAVDQGARRY
jgi:GTPase SAR1 family protein